MHLVSLDQTSPAIINMPLPKNVPVRTKTISFRLFLGGSLEEADDVADLALLVEATVAVCGCERCSVLAVHRPLR